MILHAILLAAGFGLFAVPDAHAELPDATRFGVSIEVGDIGAARRWLDEGLDPDFLADRIGTGLMIGAWEGDIAMMDLFFQHGANIDAINRHGEQALQLAAWRGKADAVHWLLERGAAINRRGAAWSALHYAAFAGQEGVVRMLIARGADVNARAPNGSSVLMMAVREGHEALVQPLLAAGADPALRNDQGDTALSWAMRHGHFAIAEQVASPAAFAAAAREPSNNWGKAIRSAAAPADISELMRRIRVLESSGQRSDKLRRELHAAVEAFKQGSRRETVAERALPPRAMMITARRGKPGEERAQLLGSAAAPTKAAAMPRSRVADILYRLRQAEAAGQPTGSLRQELLDAVAAMQAGG